MNGCHTTSILSCIHNQVTQELIATLLSELGFTPLPKTVIASYFFKEANCANFRAAQNISGVRLNLDQTSLSNLTCRVIAYSGHFLMCNRSMLQRAISEGKVVTVDLESCTPCGLPNSAPTTASTVRPSESSPLSNHWQTPYLNKPLTETVREPTVPVDAGMPIGMKIMIIAMGLLPLVIVAIVVWCLSSRAVVEYGQVPRENIELRSLPPALQSDHSSTDWMLTGTYSQSEPLFQLTRQTIIYNGVFQLSFGWTDLITDIL